MTLPTLVYALCALTSAFCAALLVRAYWRTKARLLLWSAIAFVCLAINNALVFADLVVVGPEISLVPYRHFAALAAVSVMIFGCIRDAE
jgi:uncharacterized membrane protein